MNTIINGIVYKNTMIKSFECIDQHDLNRLDEWVNYNVGTLLTMISTGAGNDRVSSMYIVITYIPKSENQQ